MSTFSRVGIRNVFLDIFFHSKESIMLTFVLLLGTVFVVLWAIGTWLVPDSWLGKRVSILNAWLFRFDRRSKKNTPVEGLHQAIHVRKKEIHTDANTVNELSLMVKAAERAHEKLLREIAELEAGYVRDLQQLKDAQAANDTEAVEKEKRQALQKKKKLSDRQAQLPESESGLTKLQTQLELAKAEMRSAAAEAVNAQERATKQEARLRMAELRFKFAERNISASTNGGTEIDRKSDLVQQDVNAAEAKVSLYEEEGSVKSDSEALSALADEELLADLAKLDP